MRKIIVQEFITLDGIMQAPGAPEEDTASGFKFGGWVAPYFTAVDEQAAGFMERWMQSTDILLGRKTFEIFASYWPAHADMWPGINDVNKYCVSTTLEKPDWNNAEILRNVDDIRRIKNATGGDIKVHGSGNLAQTLFSNDLVDELCLMTFPITLGTGKRLFDTGTIPAAFDLTDSLVTKNGVIFTYFKRAGEVQTGVVGG